jgi:hypothetical protein
VPGSLLIEVLAPDDSDLPALVEALIVGSEPLGPDDLGLMVAAAQVLRTRAPDDPRWPQWEARATEITRQWRPEAWHLARNARIVARQPGKAVGHLVVIGAVQLIGSNPQTSHPAVCDYFRISRRADWWVSRRAS